MIITITGLPGSGKSTVGRMVAKQLGVPFYSMGDLRAKMALERGLTIDQLNALGETEAFTDTDVDDYQTKLGASGASCVIDGRLSWHFIPSSFKVFLDVRPEVGAQRVYRAIQGGGRPDEPPYPSVDAARAGIEARVQSDQRRYTKHYGIDFLEKSPYDLVVDTSEHTPEDTARVILDNLPTER